VFSLSRAKANTTKTSKLELPTSHIQLLKNISILDLHPSAALPLIFARALLPPTFAGRSYYARQILILGTTALPQCRSPNQVKQVSVHGLIQQYIPLGALRHHRPLPHLSPGWPYQVGNRPVSKFPPFTNPPSWTCMNPPANKKILFVL
jgi:hypothetical protein